MTLRRTEIPKMSAKRAAEFAAAGRSPRSTLDKPTAPKMATSPKRHTDTGPDAATADAVVDREQHSCAVCGKWLEPYGRGSSWSIHHRRRIRTDNRLSNLIAVCGGADVPGCHQEIHANVAKAEDAGWLCKRSTKTTEKVMAHSQFGWVRLTDDGDVIRASKEEPDEHPF